MWDDQAAPPNAPAASEGGEPKLKRTVSEFELQVQMDVGTAMKQLVQMDLNGDGRVDVDELAAFMDISEEDAAHMIAAVDFDGDGMLCVDEVMALDVRRTCSLCLHKIRVPVVLSCSHEQCRSCALQLQEIGVVETCRMCFQPGDELDKKTANKAVPPALMTAMMQLKQADRMTNRVAKAKMRGETTAMIRRFIGHNDSSAPGFHALGVSLIAESDDQGAQAAFERAVEIDPRMAIAHTRLAKLAVRRGDKGAGIAHFNAASELEQAVRRPSVQLDTARRNSRALSGGSPISIAFAASTNTGEHAPIKRENTGLPSLEEREALRAADEAEEAAQEAAGETSEEAEEGAEEDVEDADEAEDEAAQEAAAEAEESAAQEAEEEEAEEAAQAAQEAAPEEAQDQAQEEAQEEAQEAADEAAEEAAHEAVEVVEGGE
jgi:hypothetical protein